VGMIHFSGTLPSQVYSSEHLSLLDTYPRVLTPRLLGYHSP
jgi:hypothetical protein